MTDNKYACTRCGGTGEEPEAVPADQLPSPKLTPEGLARALRNNGYLVPVRVLENALKRGVE